MDDYQDIEKECKEIEKSSELQQKNLKRIFDKVNAFQTCMKSLKESISAIPDLSNSPYEFLDGLLKNFSGLLEKNNLMIKSLILRPITNLMNSVKEAFSQYLKSLNEIKYNLSDEKIKLLNKQDEYLILSNIDKHDKKHKHRKNSEKTEKDEKIFKDAIKENNEQLYKYELDKMNEIIDENNEKYKNINMELNAIKANSILVLKESLIQFSLCIKNFSEILKLLSGEIMNKIEISFKDNDIVQSFDEKKNQINEIRFKKEMIDNSQSIINKKNKINNFNIMENNDDEYEDLEKGNYISDLAEKLLKNSEEIKFKEISNLLNILKTKDKKTNVSYSSIFLIKMRRFSKNGVLSIKNKQNFIHLSNIINNLCINDKDNINTFYSIIEISKMIIFQNIFLYKKIREKNEYFSTKSLWSKIIIASLVEKIKKYIKGKVNKKDDKNKKNKKNKDDKNKEDKEKEKENGKDKEKEKENVKDKEKDNDNLKKFLKKKGLIDDIKDYKKLNKNQTKDLNIFTKKIMFAILSTLIPSMHCFQVKDEIIEELIEDYNQFFKFEIEEFSYLKNITKIKGLIKKSKDLSKKNLDLDSKIFILLLSSKYIPLNEYPKLLTLNKKIYNSLKRKIFENSKMMIDKNLKFWNICLKIESIKTQYVYKGIKSGINLSIFQDQISKGTKESKNMQVIEQDLKRTFFLKTNPTHFESIRAILNCFLITCPQIGYCQGMNCFVSFLYQLLDNDEEKTFYYLCGLELNTKYHEIFEDDFITLSIFFNVFDNILLNLKPDVYYKFKNSNILPNCYCSSWFITLFTEFINIVDKNNPPLLAMFIFNKFIFENWTTIFNFGYMLIELCYQNICNLNKDKLMAYIMNIFDEENIFSNEKYEKCRDIYLKNEEIINDEFINKLIDISKYEYYHKEMIIE